MTRREWPHRVVVFVYIYGSCFPSPQGSGPLPQTAGAMEPAQVSPPGPSIYGSHLVGKSLSCFLPPHSVPCNFLTPTCSLLRRFCHQLTSLPRIPCLTLTPQPYRWSTSSGQAISPEFHKAPFVLSIHCSNMVANLPRLCWIVSNYCSPIDFFAPFGFKPHSRLTEDSL